MPTPQHKTIHLAHPQSDTHNALLKLIEDSQKCDKEVFKQSKASYVKIASKIAEIISSLPSKMYIIISTHPTKTTTQAPAIQPNQSPHATTYIAQVVSENHPIWENGEKYIAMDPLSRSTLVSPKCQGKHMVIVTENKKAAQGIEATLDSIGAAEVITVAIT